VPKWKGRKFKKNYPLHNISTKIVCVRDQAWRKRANLVPFSCVHNLLKIVHQLSCDFGYSYQWEADPLYQALAFFIHSLWVVFRGIDNRSNYVELSKALSTSVEMSMTWITPGSLCLIEVVTRYGTFGIQSASFFL
jgi:hypothetical protein